MSGQYVATLATAVDSYMANQSAPTHVLINSSVNSFLEAGYETDMGTLADKIHAMWPSSQVWFMRPWKRGFNTEADSYATAVGNVVTARSSWAHLGPDERSWLKGADDGATMTVDGIHYSAAGEIECAAQWQTFLGY